MATPAENLQTSYANICQQLADVTANPKPSYSVGGVSISWADYLRLLIDQQKGLLQAIQLAAGPWEITEYR